MGICGILLDIAGYLLILLIVCGALLLVYDILLHILDI